MNRNIYLKNKRAEFIKLCDSDIKKAAKEMRDAADALENCRTTADKIFAMSQILFISESTIEKDLYNNGN